MNGGGPGSGVWKSTDGGETWAKIERGLPAGPKGRIGMDVYRKDPRVPYARVEHATESGVYRSDDGGANWRKLSTVNPRPMYFSQIRVDPSTDSRIYVLGVSLHVSDDGGRTFREDGAERIHVDHYPMWTDPSNPRHLLIGNDGGVSLSYDRAETWQWLPNLVLGRAGFLIVGLIVFRIVWGLIGSPTARFASFVRGPGAIRAYLRGEWRGIGHNPIGALSVLGLLALVTAQATTGLFTNDDIAYQGPLADLVGKDQSDRFHSLHAWLQNGLLALVVLHVGAIVFYLHVKKENLVKPMITGWREVTPQAALPHPRQHPAVAASPPSSSPC